MNVARTKKKVEEEKRRAPGEGSLYRQGRVWWFSIVLDGKRFRRSLNTHDRDVAEIRARQYYSPAHATTRAELAASIAAARGAMHIGVLPLKESWERFAKHPRRGKASVRTMHDYRAIWQAFLDWLAAERPQLRMLGDLTRVTAEDYATSLIDRNVAAATYNKHINILSLVCRTLADAAGLSDNPFGGITRRELAADRASKLYLTLADAAALLDALDQGTIRCTNIAEWRLAFRFGLMAGLRLGDAVNVRWEDINLTERTLTIRPRKLRRMGQRLVIPIIDPLFRALTDARAGAQPKPPDQWRNSRYITPVLHKQYTRTKAGRTVGDKGVQKMAGQIMRRALPHRHADAQREYARLQREQDRTKDPGLLGFHSLRHTFVSFAAEAGIPRAVIQDIVGHGSPAMTDHYTHVDVVAMARHLATLPDPQAKGASPQRARLQAAVLALEPNAPHPRCKDEKRALAALRLALKRLDEGES